MFKKIKIEILSKLSLSKVFSIVNIAIHALGWVGGKSLSNSLIRTNSNFKTIIFGLFLSLLALQCSTSSTTDPVATTTGTQSACQSGQTKQADGSCLGECVSGTTLQADGTCKNPDGTITCQIGQMKDASGQCVAITCLSVQTLNMNNGLCETKTCLSVQTLNMINGLCETKTCLSVQTLNMNNGLCETKTCPSGQTLNMSNGQCETNTCPLGQFMQADGSCMSLTWRSLPSSSNLNIARNGMGTATIGNKIYIFGGAGGGTVLNTTEIFDTTTEVWSILGARSNLNTARSSMGTVTISTLIYAFGGNGSSGLLNSTEVFDTTTNIWSTLGDTSNMKIARYGMGTAHVDNKIYAFGGRGSSGVLNSTEVFDIITYVWSTLESSSNLNVARNSFGTAVIGTKIYAFGGFTLGSIILNTTEVFDTATNVWSTLGSSSNLNVARNEFGTAVIGSKIYAIGGQSNENSSNIVLKNIDVFDTTRNVWSTLGAFSNLNNVRYSLGVAAVGTKIYAFGGYDTKNLNTTEVYGPIP